MIWSKLNILRALFLNKGAALEVSRRWYKAARSTPELTADVIRLGGIMVLQPIEAGEVDMSNPHRLAYEAGRRDLALQLLAMMNLSIEELNMLTEKADD